MPQLLFISGEPCTGKSLLGSYLADERGYIHIDAERDHGVDFDRVGIHQEWEGFLRTRQGHTFVRAIARLGKPIILDWGMRMNFLSIVPPLQGAGMEAWWLCADRALARIAFIKREEKKPERERIPVSRFDAQMDAIEEHWPQIQEIFGQNMLQGLRPDGSQRPAAELWGEISARAE
jgi:hypothetical protein